MVGSICVNHRNIIPYVRGTPTRLPLPVHFWLASKVV